MPLSSSPIRHPLAGSADPSQDIQFKAVSSYLSHSEWVSTIPSGNFLPIVVFYAMGALIGCYAPIG
jgi:hypothetical protein